MKKIFVYIVLIIVIIGCNKLKEPDHSIRIANKTYNALSSTKIGSVNYGTINPGKTTDYKPVQEGSHDFLSYTTNYYYSGSVSVQGNGKHDWTLTINSDGTFKFNEDK